MLRKSDVRVPEMLVLRTRYGIACRLVYRIYGTKLTAVVFAMLCVLRFGMRVKGKGGREMRMPFSDACWSAWQRRRPKVLHCGLPAI